MFLCSYLFPENELQTPTLEALVDARGEGVSQHHHSGVNDDLSAAALRASHLPLSSAPVHSQRHLIVVSVQEDLVPFSVVKAISGQG